MTIRVGRGMLSRIRQYPDHIVVQVQGCADADGEAAAAALEASREELFSLGAFPPLSRAGPGHPPDTPSFVSDVLLAPTGPLLYVDGAGTPYAALRTIPDVVTRHLVAAGVTGAVITSPPPGPLFGGREGLRHVPRAVVLRLYPPQPAPPAVGERPTHSKVLPPAGWVHEAVAWVRDGLGDDAELLAAIEVVEFPLALGQARSFFDQAARSAASWAVVVAGDMDRRLRGANGCFLLDPNLAMAAGGPEASDDELVEIFEALVALGRRLAPEVGYAFVAIDPSFGGFESNFPVCEGPPGGASPQFIRNLLEEVVPDGFPWQVLGPGHLARLGVPPPGAQPVGGGRFELAVGDPRAWLLDPPPPQDALTRPRGPWTGLTQRRRDPAPQEEARRLLAPCLVREEEFMQVYEARRARLAGSPSAPSGPT